MAGGTGGREAITWLLTNSRPRNLTRTRPPRASSANGSLVSTTKLSASSITSLRWRRCLLACSSRCSCAST